MMNEILLYDDLGDNISMDYKYSSAPEEVIDKVFRDAEVVVSGKFRHHRLTAAPMETRTIIATYNEVDSSLTVWNNTQNPRYLREQLALALGLPNGRIRIFSPTIGGGFGIKAGASYDEDFLIPAISIILKKPIKWTETRREHLQAAGQAREQIHNYSLAATKSGRILALKDEVFIDGGALNTFWASWLATFFSLTGPYKIEYVSVSAKAFFTNKAPYWACRGFGKYDATVALERMIDKLAHELRIDPLEVRLRNLVKKEEMPFRTPTGALLDSGDYERCIKRAAELINYYEMKKMALDELKKGRRLGVGIVICLEPTGVGSVHGRPGLENVRLSINPSGDVAVYLGTCDTGQNHKSTIKRLVAKELTISPKKIFIIDSDTAITPFGLGPISCRFSNYVLPATHLALVKAKDKICKIAASMLDCTPQDVELLDGEAVCRLDPSRKVTLKDIAYKAYFEADKLPKGIDPGLNFDVYFKPETIGSGNIFATYPYAAHAALVELDEETGAIRILRYCVVHDCGKVIDHAIVESQSIGSLIQGLGGAVMEELMYTDEGALTTSTFMDYLLPTAVEGIKDLILERIEHPSPVNPLGVKGAGETNTLGPLPVLSQAIEDALKDMNITIEESPLKPEYLWSLILRNRWRIVGGRSL